MKFIIEGETYDYDPDRLLNTEAIALQKATGMTVKQFGAALAETDPVALTGLVWLAMRRAGKEVPFDELEFDLGSIAVEDDTPAPEPPRPTVAARTSKRGA